MTKRTRAGSPEPAGWLPPSRNCRDQKRSSSPSPFTRCIGSEVGKASGAVAHNRPTPRVHERSVALMSTTARPESGTVPRITPHLPKLSRCGCAAIASRRCRSSPLSEESGLTVFDRQKSSWYLRRRARHLSVFRCCLPYPTEDKIRGVSKYFNSIRRNKIAVIFNYLC